MHLIVFAATLTDGTAGAIAVVSDGSATVFGPSKGQPFIRGYFSIGNDVVYSQIANNSASFLTNPLKMIPLDSVDVDGTSYLKIPPVPVENSSVFTVTGLTVAG